MAFNNTILARAAGSIWGVKLGAATTAAVLQQAAFQAGGMNSVIDGAFNASFAGVSNANVATAFVSNLGITGAAVAPATQYVTAQLNAAPAASKGSVLTTIANMFAGMTGDATLGAAASAFNAKVANVVIYGGTAGTADGSFGDVPSATSFVLGFGQDNLTGTAGDDTFTAYVVSGGNTLQDADMINGGAGTDTLYADMGESNTFAVTPITTGVEMIKIRAQDSPDGGGDNNIGNPSGVEIDAQRISGATHFESNNSRDDVVFEDVRILDSQITSDITVAFVESDPGHVDFGLYFDQYSLRNQTSATSSINLKVLDTVARAAGQAPLLNSNYGAFTFTVTQGGVSKVVTLGSKAIQDAQDYPALAVAFQAELDREFGPGAAAATVGEVFTVVDPDSRQAVSGNAIVLTTKTATTFTTPAGSGWLADGTAPPASNFYTNFTTGTTTSTSLVTSKVILDDVGRGSTGGDLVIGGLSTGATSTSLGVQRFEIEVRDNSKLESINSTNNTLREVTIKNGATSNGGYAYVPTVKDAGNLTVNGNSGTNGANISGLNGGVPVGTSGDTQNNNNAPLPGVTTNAQVFGFTDVRLIDGSTMTGKLELTAQVTNASIAKYLNLSDIQTLPAGDNVDFIYSGGANTDRLWVQLDSTAVGSRSTIVTGREDFTFTANGGAGDDALTVFVGTTNQTGDSQAWYTNQKLNKNITVNGGDGNDTIRTPGAGDVIISGGTGNDTVYADNTGRDTISINSGNAAGAVYATSEAAELARVLAILNQSNSTNDTGSASLAPLGQATATRTALETLNLLTPISFTDPLNPANPNPAFTQTKAQIQTAIITAYNAGALTSAQVLALIAAYNTSTGSTFAAATTVTNPLTKPVFTAGAAVATPWAASEFNAGNALLATYITEAEAAVATATGVDLALNAELAQLNGTQFAQINADLAVNGVASDEAGAVNGSAVILAGMTALRSALTLNATDVAVVSAITTAVTNKSITNAQGVALYGAATGGGLGTIDPAELFAVQVILEPLFAAATATNTVNLSTLANAKAANDAAAATAANTAGANPANAAATAAAEATAAALALSTYTTATVTPATTLQTDLATLKSALAVGVSELNFNLLTAAFQAKYPGIAGFAAALNTAGNAGAPTQLGTIDALEKQNVDVLITAQQEIADAAVDAALARQAVLQATVTATAFASAQAEAARLGAANDTLAPGVGTSQAVFVVNTANQQDEGASGYVRNENDERAINDLKSGTNESYNLFGTKLTVTFKGLEATADIPYTGYKTSDLQVNQAIKNAINNDPVLSKLLVAADGPSNSLVITSLIDGTMTTTNLSFALALPAVGTLNNTDIAAAAAIYGVAATEAAVLAAMATAKTAFDAKADYVDQFAESGAPSLNSRIDGAASVTTSDNTITGGDGNDVLVFGTTVGVDALGSSNDTAVFGAAFGNDTIVHFKAGSLATGGDILNFSSLGGSVLTSAFNVNRSITVAVEASATNGTPALVAGLFTDSATAQTHVYIAYNAVTNVGKVYAVTDAAGTAAGNVTAVLAGTIDLADTLWSTLTSDNFA